MDLEISTPALLFPAVSLLFLAYTNRFLHLAALVRNLHRDWVEMKDEALRSQIENLRRRLVLIRLMQLMGAVSLLLCVVSMVALFFSVGLIGSLCFIVALILMAGSLVSLILEIWCSGGALQILLKRVEDE
tara:strand:+ start:1326 stop:1718 length:393 start_codon:yes stop_codon:yes gene_type:complete